MNILITICARGGSKGVKGKNFRLLNGKPLIAYTIRQALKWGKAQKVVVSTDSEEIAHIAREYGAEVPFMRPADLATDTAPKLPSIRHALMECEKLFATRYDVVVDLDPTSPVRASVDLDNCLNLFTTHHPDTIFSVVPAHKNPYFNMVEEDAAGRVMLCKKLPGTIARRQDAPKVYDLNASIYFYNRDFIIKDKNISPITDNSRIYVMNEFAGTDIDRNVDFIFVELLVKQGIVKL
jgi:CMP-N,N'-diacetyllegionaminic acid synthase